MPDRYIKRLEHGIQLDASDRERLKRLEETSFIAEANEDLAQEGSHDPVAHIILEGLAASYRLLEDGSRQIFQFLLPGDSCDMHRQAAGWRDNSIATLVRSRVVRLCAEEVDEIADRHPNLARAFWWAMLCDNAKMRERLTSLGRRSAERRIAHLFCELHTRMKAVDLVESDEDGFDSYDFPATQPQLADAVGLTAVHVNRTLQQLRDAELVAFRARRVTIMDPARLAALGGFDPRYLHLDR